MQTICVCEHSEALLDLFSQIKAAAWDLCQIDNVTNHISNLGKDADMWPAEVQALVNGGEGVLAKLPGTNVAAIGVGSNKTKRERALCLALVISAAVGGTLDDEDERLNWYGPDLKHLIAIGRTLVPDAVPDPEDADSKDVGDTLPDADCEDDGGTVPASSKSSTRGTYRPVGSAARLRPRAPPLAAPPPRDQDPAWRSFEVMAEKQGRADDEKAWRKSEQKLYLQLKDRDQALGMRNLQIGHLHDELAKMHEELAKKDHEIASLHGLIAQLPLGD